MNDESITRDDWRFPLLTRLKNWLFGFGAAALLILAVLYGCYLYQRPAPVEDTKPAIAVTGNPATPPAKQLSVKTATKKKAEHAINTPALPEFIPQIAPLVEAAIALQPKPETATPGPVRPIPPVPPLPPTPPLPPN